MTRLWTRVGLTPTFPPLGPHPVSDLFGISVVIAMILKSLDPGRYAQHQQFESIHKLQAAFSNIYMTLLEGTACLRTLGETGRNTSSPVAQCNQASLSAFPRAASGAWGRRCAKTGPSCCLPCMHLWGH
jgi:hypothetical protein